MNGINWNLIDAVIFDVDGTLYSQKKLRVFIIIAMFKSLLLREITINDVRVLSIFRNQREKISRSEENNFLPKLFQRTAHASSTSEEQVRNIIDTWIHNRPLSFLLKCRYHGIDKLIRVLQKRGTKLAVYSDYPVSKKLDSLNINIPQFRSAEDPDIGILKPSPQGLVTLVNEMKLNRNKVVYVGDRLDTDLICAQRAGIKFILIGTKNKKMGFKNYIEFINDLN